MKNSYRSNRSNSEREGPLSLEQFKLWRTHEAAGVELMDVSSSDRCWRVVHDRYCIALCVGGVTEYRYRARAYMKRAGVVTVHEPGEAYAAHRQHGLGAASVLSIAPAVVEGWAKPEFGASPHFVPEPRAERELTRRLVRLAGAIRAGFSPGELEEHVGGALAELFLRRGEIAAKSRRRNEHRSVALVKAKIHDALHEKLSLDTLAAEVGLHKLYLLSVFREQVGVPPHTYQMQLRVARARSMLAARTPIADVVVALGFSDQSHLTRHFRRAFGVPPGRYVGRLEP